MIGGRTVAVNFSRGTLILCQLDCQLGVVVTYYWSIYFESLHFDSITPFTVALVLNMLNAYVLY